MTQTVLPSSPPRGPDWGRLVMIPLGIVAGSAAGLAAGRATDIAHLLGGALTLSFYALLIWAYLRRGAATATTTAWSAWLAAPAATVLPFALPFLGDRTASASAAAIGDVLLVLGVAWAVWSVRTLDRSLSVLPQARELIRHGPYAHVRHPLYLGEIVAMLGLALTAGGPPPLLGWALFAGLQAHRAVHEERLLSAVLPTYRDYQDSTRLLLPTLR